MAENGPSAWQLERVMSRVQETLAQLRDGEGLVLDTAEDVLTALNEEGVDARKILQRVVRAALDAKAMGIAQDLRVADLRVRRERTAREEQMWRATALAIAETILPADAEGKRKYKDPEFTLSVSPGKPKLIITDPTVLPDRLVDITVTRVPNKTAILSAVEDRKALISAMLKDGEEPPGEIEGIAWSNAENELRIRSK